MTTIFATFQTPGFHYWAGAPNWCAYLRDKHRHMFHVRVEVVVSGDNREVEFICLKNEAQLIFERLADDHAYGSCDFGPRSCEMLAKELGDKLIEKYRYAVHAVEVSEDGENGARYEYPNLSAR